MKSLLNEEETVEIDEETGAVSSDGELDSRGQVDIWSYDQFGYLMQYFAVVMIYGGESPPSLYLFVCLISFFL